MELTIFIILTSLAIIFKGKIDDIKDKDFNIVNLIAPGYYLFGFANVIFTALAYNLVVIQEFSLKQL